MNRSVRALVMRGARERLAPVVTTALATGLALLPLLGRDRSSGGNEIVRIRWPWSILGGLVTATLVNLWSSLRCTCGSRPARKRRRSAMPWSCRARPSARFRTSE